MANHEDREWDSQWHHLQHRDTGSLSAGERINLLEKDMREVKEHLVEINIRLERVILKLGFVIVLGVFAVEVAMKLIFKG